MINSNKRKPQTLGFRVYFMGSISVPGVGIEPTCLTATNFKSVASTNFATRATLGTRDWGLGTGEHNVISMRFPASSPQSPAPSV